MCMALVAAPVLAALGLDATAALIFSTASLICLSCCSLVAFFAHICIGKVMCSDASKVSDSLAAICKKKTFCSATEHQTGCSRIGILKFAFLRSPTLIGAAYLAALMLSVFCGLSVARDRDFCNPSCSRILLAAASA